jgi:hypothetical protein
MTKQKRCYLKRKSNGWKAGGLQLPPEIWSQVMEYKNALMIEFRKKNNDNAKSQSAEVIQ